MIVFPPNSSQLLFVGLFRHLEMGVIRGRGGGRGEEMGTEIRLKQKWDGMNREAFCFVLFLGFFFSFFLKKIK